MRKLVLGLALLTVFIGCKDNEDDLSSYPCRYNGILKTLENPATTRNTIVIVPTTEFNNLFQQYIRDREITIIESKGTETPHLWKMSNGDKFVRDSLVVTFYCVHR